MMTPTTRPAKALIVEDDPLSQLILKLLLERRGARVELANSGERVLELGASVCEFDLVFMDVCMDGIDGFETTRRLLRLPGCTETPVIGMSAKVFAEDRRRALASGMQTLLAKPVEPDQVERVLRDFAP